MLIFGDNFRSKMQSLDDEKAGQEAILLPLQSRIDKQNNSLETVSKEDRDETAEMDRSQELEAANSKLSQAKHEMALVVAEQIAENIQVVNEGIPVVQTKQHNRPFSQCSNPFSRCKAWRATVSWNSSWRLARWVMMSRKSAR